MNDSIITTQPQTTPVHPPDADALLTPEETAAWMKIKVRKLQEISHIIKPIRIGNRIHRYHKPTVLMQLQSRDLMVKPRENRKRKAVSK